MNPQPPISTLTTTHYPYTTLCRTDEIGVIGVHNFRYPAHMLGEVILIIEDFVTNVAVPEGMLRSRLLVLPAEEGGALADDRTEAGTRLFDRQKISASRAGEVIILAGNCRFRERGAVFGDP